MVKQLINTLTKKTAAFFPKKRKVPGTPDGRGTADQFAATYREREGARQEKRLEKDREKYSHQRRESRQNSFTVASLSMPDRGISIDGVILEASHNGLTFRPATNYIENRIGESIQILVGPAARNGIVRSARPDGYGIQLFDPLTDDDLVLIAEESVDLQGYKAA